MVSRLLFLFAAAAGAMAIAVSIIVALTHIPDWALDARYWWRTPDQVGHDNYLSGAFAQAAGHFHAADWRGTACYRTGDLNCAEAAFAQAALLPGGATAEISFNRGNVAARSGRLGDALGHYDAALSQRPDWQAPRENRALVLAALAERQRESQREAGGEPSLPPDGTVIDERGKQGKPGRIEVEKLDSDAQAKLWLRNVRSDPGAFLRLRFADEQRAETKR